MKRPLTIWCLVAASLVGVVAWADLVLVLKGVSLTSATINTAGTTLTLVYSTATTVSDATGLTVEFDNYAQRTLTYASGSGTDTHVFNFASPAKYTDADTDNDTAPVGTVCTLDYDNATGNISGLSSLTDQAVTNNSTAHPDPDLPEAVDTSLPTNWNATADYTPADAAALQELLDGDGSGDATNGTSSDWTIIQLASDGTNYGPLTVDDSCQYILIRTDAYASLPAYGSRLLATDDGNGYLALFNRTPSQSAHTVLTIAEGSGIAGANHIRFIGCKFSMDGTFASDISYMCGVGEENGTTDTTPLPEFIGFDRCLFTAVDAVDVRDTLRMDATDSFVIGSRFENLHGAGNDGSTGIRTYVGDRLAYHNNYFETESAATFLGENALGLARDVTITNNQMTRDVTWDDANGVQKAAALETKTGLRVLFKNNSVSNATWQQSNFGAIMIKADGAGGPKNTSHVTIVNTKIYNCDYGIWLHVDGSSPGSGVGPNHDMLVRNCLMYDAGTSPITGTLGSDPDWLLRLKYKNVTCVGEAFWFSDSGQYFVCTDNIIHGQFRTSDTSTGTRPEGADSFNNGWIDTYDVQYNIFVGRSAAAYDNDASPAPLGTLANNLFPADTAAVGYEDAATDDYRLSAGSSYIAASSTGGPIGCDVAALNTIMSGVEE